MQSCSNLASLAEDTFNTRAISVSAIVNNTASTTYYLIFSVATYAQTLSNGLTTFTAVRIA
jgi:hypothetical protein